MWMAEPMEGEVVGELPTYAPAFKEALYPGGDGRKCFGGNGLVPEVSGRGDAREITFHLASVGEGGASGR
jgi:hypothetical protein